LAEYITNKLGQTNPGWLKGFYPRRKDFVRIMEKQVQTFPHNVR
jgi:hypothetical protein